MLLSIAFLISLDSTALGQAKSVNVKSPIVYKLVSNRIDPRLSDTDVERRLIEVLVNPRDFTKTNLEGLFEYLSTQFPSPNLLLITVYSSRKDFLKKGEIQQIPDLRTSNSSLHGDLSHFTRVADKRNFLLYFRNGDFDNVEMK